MSIKYFSFDSISLDDKNLQSFVHFYVNEKMLFTFQKNKTNQIVVQNTSDIKSTFSSYSLK